MLAVLLAASDPAPDALEPPAPAWPGTTALVAGSLVATIGGLAALAIGLAPCPRLRAGLQCSPDYGVPIGALVAGALVVAFGVGG